MSKYRFEYTNTTDGLVLAIELPDTDENSPDIEAVVGAFEQFLRGMTFVQFLRGMTFVDKNIAKIIKHDLAGG